MRCKSTKTVWGMRVGGGCDAGCMYLLVAFHVFFWIPQEENPDFISRQGMLRLLTSFLDQISRVVTKTALSSGSSRVYQVQV